MKKTILLILNVLCLLLVCGCNNGRLNYDDQNIELYVGDTYIIEVSDKSFTFVQSQSSDTWVIFHNLN